MAVDYNNEVEKIYLQGKLGGDTRASLYDLRMEFYRSKGVGANIRSRTDAERAYLQGVLGVTNIQSLHDLREMYAASLGVAYQVDNQDMVEAEYKLNLGGGGNPTNGLFTQNGTSFILSNNGTDFLVQQLG